VKFELSDYLWLAFMLKWVLSW